MNATDLHNIVKNWPERYRPKDISYSITSLGIHGYFGVSDENAAMCCIGKAIEQLASEGWFIRRTDHNWIVMGDCTGWILDTPTDATLIHAIDAAIRHVESTTKEKP